MTKTEELAGLETGESCLGRAANDEPLFLLRACDVLAAVIVRQWADLAEQRHLAAGSLHAKEKAKIAEARVLALKMDEYRVRLQCGKLPD